MKTHADKLKALRPYGGAHGVTVQNGGRAAWFRPDTVLAPAPYEPFPYSREEWWRGWDAAKA